MKTLECSRCHRLYKNTEDRMVVVCEGEVTNYCPHCTSRLWKLADLGMRVKKRVDRDGLVIVSDRGIEDED